MNTQHKSRKQLEWFSKGLFSLAEFLKDIQVMYHWVLVEVNSGRAEPRASIKSVALPALVFNLQAGGG